MIPKIIHYCWFGRGTYPEKVENCIKTWKTILSGYEFKLWNEDSFDVNSVQFVKEAYAAKRFAFVSDYVRVFALKTYGGIYLDTDIEVVKKLDPLLLQKAVLGTDEGGYLTAFMASEPNHPYFTSLLLLYQNMHFIKPDGTQNTEVNNTWMQNILRQYGYRKVNKEQHLKEGILLLPCEFFHAKSLTSGKLMVTDNTYCIHHHTLLWISPKTKIIRFLRMKILVPLMGAERYTKLTDWIKDH